MTTDKTPSPDPVDRVKVVPAEPEALRVLREARRRREQSRATPSTPLPAALQSRFAKSVRMRTGLQLNELGDLWSTDPQRVLNIVMLVVALGHEKGSVFDQQRFATRAISLISESLEAREGAIGSFTEGALAPIWMTRHGQPVEPSREAAGAMTEAIRSASPVFRDAAVAIPLIVAGECTGAVYLARPADQPGFRPDLPYLATVARIIAWQALTVRMTEALKIERAAAEARAAKAESRADSAERARDALKRELDHIEQAGYYEHVKGRQSPAFRPVLRAMFQAARSDTTALITGDTGTGKTMLAEAIHFTDHPDNRFRSGPFIEANLASMAESIIESELFGHAAGAYTDARTAAKGLAEQADGGTLFLDEVGELSLRAQKSLLRLVEKKVVRPVGGAQDLVVDIRIIAATNKDLKQMVSDGTFREDLYYRLKRLQIHLPSLKERREDLPLLAEHFFEAAKKQHRKPSLKLSAAARNKLFAYSWPGNVRELDAEIERVVISATGTRVRVDDVQVSDHAPAGAGGLPIEGFKAATQGFQRELIRRAVTKTAGNVRAAAVLLQIKHDTQLYEMIRRLGMNAKELREEARQEYLKATLEKTS